MASYEKKTQIYVSKEQWARLQIEGRTRNISAAEIVREAIDAHFSHPGAAGFEQALDRSAGAWRSRRDVPSGKEYVDATRAGWTNRAAKSAKVQKS